MKNIPLPLNTGVPSRLPYRAKNIAERVTDVSFSQPVKKLISEYEQSAM